MIKIFKKKNIIRNLIILNLMLFVIFCIVNRNDLLKIIYPKEYSELVVKYAKVYEIDEELIYALIKAESKFNENAVSNKGALGLMQLMESTASEVATKLNIELRQDNLTEDILVPDTNINLGTKYLADLITKYGNIELAVAAYNAGIGTVDKWIEDGTILLDGSDIENIPYDETNNYVRKVMRDYGIYISIYE